MPLPPLLRAPERLPLLQGKSAPRVLVPSLAPVAVTQHASTHPWHWWGTGCPLPKASSQPCPPQGVLLVPDDVEPLVGGGHCQAGVKPHIMSWCRC